MTARPTDLATPHAAGDAARPEEVARAERALRAERVRVAHWRRLVQARTDLAVASLAHPGALGGGLEGTVCAPEGPDLLLHLGLVEAVSTGGPEGELDRLEHLRSLDLRLAAYESTLTEAFAAAVMSSGLRRATGSAAVPAPRRTEGGPMGQTVPGM